MASYLVCYSLGERNQYIYPEVLAGVTWKSAVYHATERKMVGETDQKVKSDGKNVIALKPAEAAKLVKQYRASYPEPKPLPHEALAKNVGSATESIGTTGGKGERKAGKHRK
ncbi:MAG: hypothetical protein HYV04_05475 [Deltaproteobacteria bacterium]|nr:hypothetical protein [Deltaproteobacteria bacterium]